MNPTPEDVIFGRACMAFGLVSTEQVTRCVADLRRLASQGRTVTLAQVLIGRKLINANQYHDVVRKIQERRAQMQQTATATAPPPLPPTPPEITNSGRYQFEPPRPPSPTGFSAPPPMPTPHTPPRPAPIVAPDDPPPSEEEIHEAARSWDDASTVVQATYEVVTEPAKPAPQPGVGGGNGILMSPRGARERKDAGIRNMLGVPEDQDQFDFGPYRILGDVASGGMGIIYRAQIGDTGQIYALKALLNVENASEKQLRRFIQEAQSAMRLDHPGIVKIHDLGIFENIPYFTMDLVDGDDLHHHLKNKTFKLNELIKIFVQTAEAVHYAHENGVIHRDLKPANIIVRRPDAYPVLTDFGLAKNLDSSFKLTAEGAMVGTPLYLSPEQVSGKAQEVDRRCDVYGLGVMLYQILTGKLPFVGRNPYEVYRKVLDEDPTPPTAINPEVSPDLEKVCLMALAKDREERYATAQLMADELKRFMRGEPVEAKLPTPAVSRDPEASQSRRRKERERQRRDELPPSPPGTIAVIALFVVLIVLGLAYIVYLLVTG